MNGNQSAKMFTRTIMRKRALDFSRNLYGTMKAKRNDGVHWISFERVFHCSFAIGVFVGWNENNRLAVVGLQIGFWILVIGPHTIDST